MFGIQSLNPSLFFKKGVFRIRFRRFWSPGAGVEPHCYPSAPGHLAPPSVSGFLVDQLNLNIIKLSLFEDPQEGHLKSAPFWQWRCAECNCGSVDGGSHAAKRAAENRPRGHASALASAPDQRADHRIVAMPVSRDLRVCRSRALTRVIHNGSGRGASESTGPGRLQPKRGLGGG